MDQNNDRWEACPAGTLHEIARRSRASKRAKRALTHVSIAAFSSVAMLLIIVGIKEGLPFGSPTVSCVQVEAMLPDYVANRLSPAKRASVERHVKKCSLCAFKLLDLQKSVGLSASNQRIHRLHYEQTRPTMALRRATSRKTTVWR